MANFVKYIPVDMDKKLQQQSDTDDDDEKEQNKRHKLEKKHLKNVQSIIKTKKEGGSTKGVKRLKNARGKKLPGALKQTKKAKKGKAK